MMPTHPMPRLIHGNSKEELKRLPTSSVDAIVTDPPYELGFMGKKWDKTGIAYDVELWREALRVLKPGGHLLSFSGSRTYHRMTCAIEDAGFEIRDCIMWVYGSGFPKSLDVSKAIDKAAGVEREVVGVRRAGITPGGNLCNHGVAEADKMRPITAPATQAAQQWQGWGTSLKPALEPICVARKPLIGTVAANVQKHGTGGLNIDGCRIGTESTRVVRPSGSLGRMNDDGWQPKTGFNGSDKGRWPANLILDGSAEVLAGFPETAASKVSMRGIGLTGNDQKVFGKGDPEFNTLRGHSDNGGSAARFFYCAKASKSDRGEGNTHPTVKPTDLMRYLVRLVCPPGGVVLDPFNGSGSTGKACALEGFGYIGIDLDADYIKISESRIDAAVRSINPQQSLFAA